MIAIPGKGTTFSAELRRDRLSRRTRRQVPAGEIDERERASAEPAGEHRVAPGAAPVQGLRLGVGPADVLTYVDSAAPQCGKGTQASVSCQRPRRGVAAHVAAVDGPQPSEAEAIRPAHLALCKRSRSSTVRRSSSCSSTAVTICDRVAEPFRAASALRSGRSYSPW